MRGKSCAKQGNTSKSVSKVEEEGSHHLSSAYIRTLVKELTCTNQMDSEKSDADYSELSPQQPAHQQRKQVRRRLHTSRPYQEKLLNMAEARKEIVTALKSHRAAMKQQQQQQQQQQLPDIIQMQQILKQEEEVQVQVSEEGKKSSKSKRIYAASTSTNNNSSSSCYHPPLICPPNYNYNPYSFYPSLMPPPIAPPILQYFPESFNLSALPYQPLGLNLNYQDFDIDSTCCFFNNPSQSSSSSSPPPPPMSCFSSDEFPQIQDHQLIPPTNPQIMVSEDIVGLHHAVDDKEMEEIRSVGEQHQIEWNDTMNVVTSARWFKFLKSMEFENEDENGYHDELKQQQQQLPFDEQVMEVPSWLNSNEGPLEDCLCLPDYCSDDYMHDDLLPCMEIEEIEGMDGEWLSS